MNVAGQRNPCIHIRAGTHHGTANSDDEKAASEEEKETQKDNCGEHLFMHIF